ncbi:hypothetical protein PQR46_07275 [Paraburkholderia sediminicola]|uniref:hypothetical protein n=1 Tax=Paraburkholderia sediminicola TaxID=458836 RepID=UPI0038B9CCCA
MQTRGPLVGQCNICGDVGKLTEDHTPPKGVIRVGQMELHHITTRISPRGPQTKWRNFQNGVKYRTLCGPCNNGLGTHDDPALIDFSGLVHSVMKSKWPLSAGVVRPQNVMRSVIGHLSAQGVDRYRKGPRTELVAWYLTDRRLTLPSTIKVYWWTYPFKHQVLVRDCTFMDLPSGHPIHMWIMKFFPLAFLVVFECPREIRFPANELSVFRDFLSDETARIEIDCRSTLYPYWPEAPSDDSIVLYGPEAAFAQQVEKAVSKKPIMA